MFRKQIIIISLVVMAFFCINSTNPVSTDMWELVWEENFSTNKLDTNIWVYMRRANDESRKYHSSNPICYEIKNGKLILKGIVNNNIKDDTAAYLTGAISTFGKKSFDVGRLEIRAKLQSAIGAWPAFWMLPFPSDKNWPENGELDIMEHLNNDEFVYQTVHSKYTKDHPNEKPQRFVKAPFFKNEYNIYRIDFLSDKIEYYINGIKTLSYPKIDSLVDEGQFPYYHNWYLMLNMQLGGNWVGKIDPKTLPAIIEIDWIKYYRPPI